MFSDDALPAPTYVAYFTVRIPVESAQRESKRAHEILTRYLYHGEVTSVQVADALDVFLLSVRVETTGTHRDLASMVQANRDRLSSGLYGSTDPVYLMRIGPSD